LGRISIPVKAKEMFREGGRRVNRDGVVAYDGDIDE
jgi:hypothetical protein